MCVLKAKGFGLLASIDDASDTVDYSTQLSTVNSLWSVSVTIWVSLHHLNTYVTLRFEHLLSTLNNLQKTVGRFLSMIFG